MCKSGLATEQVRLSGLPLKQLLIIVALYCMSGVTAEITAIARRN
jgi:DNA-binding MarR family transcriptional regulator